MVGGPADPHQDVDDIRGAQSLINHYAALRALNAGNAAVQATAASGTAAAVDQLQQLVARFTHRIQVAQRHL